MWWSADAVVSVYRILDYVKSGWTWGVAGLFYAVRYVVVLQEMYWVAQYS